MAALAAGPEHSSMQIRLWVAIQAGAIRLDIGLIGMAVLAICLCVSAVQQIKTIVLEIAHPVSPIMAFQAIQAVDVHMFRHSIVIVADMASHTIQGAGDVAALLVAGFTIERLIFVVSLVVGQAEIGEFSMIYVGEGKIRDHGVVSLVLAMAVGAVFGR